MAWRNLEQFFIDLSSNVQLQGEFAKDPDVLMDSYGLTDDEKKLVLSKDEAAIREYLGDAYLRALSINYAD